MVNGKAHHQRLGEINNNNKKRATTRKTFFAEDALQQHVSVGGGSMCRISWLAKGRRWRVEL
jgi:hypothetical protein